MGERDEWQARWREGRTAWDQAGPSPHLDQLIGMAREAELLRDGARLLEPGCGRAHNGAALARAGYRATSFDLVPEAMNEARRLYENVSGLTLAVANAVEPPPEWNGVFDAVLDRAMLCALPPSLRSEYLRAMFGVLKPGGAFLGIPFLEVVHGPDKGPPYMLTRAQLDELLAPGFTLVRGEEHDVPGDDKIKRELVSVWRRNPHWQD